MGAQTRAWKGGVRIMQLDAIAAKYMGTCCALSKHKVLLSLAVGELRPGRG